MINEMNNNRKHYRVYARKNNKNHKNFSKYMRDTNNNKLICGIIGLAFLKGLFWGYVLKGFCKRK